jgi:predicted metallo-beta-lactamase superfamily hydrolase
MIGKKSKKDEIVREKNLILKIISNKTNNSKKNENQMIDKKKLKGEIEKKTNFINYFK